jgi:hypothetical protein
MATTQPAKPSVIVATLMSRVVGPGLKPRSAEFRWGLASGLDFFVFGHVVPQPFVEGSVHHDAFAAGVQAAHTAWHIHMDEVITS